MHTHGCLYHHTMNGWLSMPFTSHHFGLQLGTGDKTYSIIQQSLAKLGIPGEAKAYDLYQVLGDKRNLDVVQEGRGGATSLVSQACRPPPFYFCMHNRLLARLPPVHIRRLALHHNTLIFPQALLLFPPLAIMHSYNAFPPPLTIIMFHCFSPSFTTYPILRPADSTECQCLLCPQQ